MEGSHIELRSLVQQGETYRNTGQYSEAIQCFTRVIEMNRTYAWAYAHRGATRMAIDDWQNCEEDFATAVKLNPAYGWAYTHWPKPTVATRCAASPRPRGASSTPSLTGRSSSSTRRSLCRRRAPGPLLIAARRTRTSTGSR